MMMPIHLNLTLASDDLLGHVLPHELFKIPLGPFGSFSFTNHLLMTVLVAVFMLILFPWMAAQTKKKPVPTGTRNFFEAILSYLRTEVYRPALGEHADRFAPFLWTLFFFILLNNLLGMVPVSQIMSLSFGLNEVGASAMSNINITAALAVCAFFAIHLSGIAQQVRIAMDPSLDPHAHHHGTGEGGHGGATVHAVKGLPFPAALIVGVGKYIWNYAPHPEVGYKILDVALWAFLLVLEMIGTFVKPFSLCVRLFANILAGHLLLAALVALIPLGAGVAWGMTAGIGVVVVLGCAALSCLEVFVCFLQAYIFMFLTMLFIGSAVAPEH